MTSVDIRSNSRPVKQRKKRPKGQLVRCGGAWSVKSFPAYQWVFNRQTRKREKVSGWKAEVSESLSAPGSPIKSFIKWHVVEWCRTEESALRRGQQTVEAIRSLQGVR